MARTIIDAVWHERTLRDCEAVLQLPMAPEWPHFSLTFGQLEAHARAIAHLLMGAGIGPGARDHGQRTHVAHVPFDPN